MEPEPERYSQVPLFEGLTPVEILQLMKIADDLTVGEGDVVVREGEAGEAIYVIITGAFEVRKSGLADALAKLGEMSFFGEMALVTNEARNASVVAATDGRLKRIPMDRFRAMVTRGEIGAYKVIHNMSRILARRLARVQQRFVGEMARIAAQVSAARAFA